MKEMLKLEFRKALRNKSFYISLIIGCIITMFSLVYNIEIYQNEIMMIQGDRLNPMYGVLSLFNRWIGGEPFSFGSSAYFFVFPLLVAIPYGWSYCEEKQSGYTEGVKFSVSMGKIFFDKNKICIIVLSKFLVFCCRIIYLIIVLPIRLRLYLNFKIFCSTNNGISNPFSWALPTPGLGNKLGFSGNTINAEGIR